MSTDDLLIHRSTPMTPPVEYNLNSLFGRVPRNRDYPKMYTYIMYFKSLLTKENWLDRFWWWGGRHEPTHGADKGPHPPWLTFKVEHVVKIFSQHLLGRALCRGGTSWGVEYTVHDGWNTIPQDCPESFPEDCLSPRTLSLLRPLPAPWSPPTNKWSS